MQIRANNDNNWGTWYIIGMLPHWEASACHTFWCPVREQRQDRSCWAELNFPRSCLRWCCPQEDWMHLIMSWCFWKKVRHRFVTLHSWSQYDMSDFFNEHFWCSVFLSYIISHPISNPTWSYPILSSLELSCPVVTPPIPWHIFDVIYLIT